MLKRLTLLSASALLLCGALSAEEAGPVSWQVSHRDAGSDGLYEVVFEARIASPWHIYDLGPYETGPNPTTIEYGKSAGLTPVGAPYEITKATRVDDPIFGIEIGYFSHAARIGQKVRVTQPPATLTGTVEWMACNDGMCLPPAQWAFSVTIGQKENGAALPDAPADAVPPEDTLHRAEAETTIPAAPGAVSDTLWAAMLAAILWGFAAVFTPCVYPMIPLTISYFLKNDKGRARGRRNAILYGIFIVLLYTVPIAAIILITRLAGGDAVTADIFNWLSTHWIPNVIFFIAFMIFAASFFGAFEITLPARWTNRSDRRADRGGVAGIFFLALTLVLVSFSCTGVIVGNVLLQSTSGAFWEPMAAIFAFSFIFAMPFVFFAFFPELLEKIPNSGSWMNELKVTIAFLEVALGLKFLSVADQTYHWGILDREIYLAIWIVVFALAGFYLLGKIRFKHDTPVKSVGLLRLTLVIAFFTFTLYLVPGMWGAPLKGISGLLPPLTTQDFVSGGHQASVSARLPDATGIAWPGEGKYSNFLHLPFGLQGFYDLDEALAWADFTDKPLFVDFTGHGCVNCREMEMRVWSDPRVFSLLRDGYVVAALYSDDKKRLPEHEWVTDKGGNVLKTLGRKNSYIARTRFGANAQPYYLLLDGKGDLLVPPRGYDLSAEGFAAFLEQGIAAYRERNFPKL